MAPLAPRWAALLGLVASSSLKLGLAADPRPTQEEWKKEQNEAAAAKAAKAADEKKGAAVGKAIQLLESLKAKVEAEGEAEAQTYNKFACFCKDTSKEKSEAIQKGEDAKTSLIADINELSTLRGTLDDTIATTAAEIDSTEKSLKEATASRKATLKVYETNAADLSAAMDALSGAIKTLKASKNPQPPKDAPEETSLLQRKAAWTSVSKTVSRAFALANALGLADGATMGETDRKLIAFLQEPANGNEVPMEDYDFHSNGIIATLEKLQESFRAEKVEVDKEEADSVAQYEQYVQESEGHLKALNKRLAETKQKKEETTAEIEANSQRLTTTEATLKDDKEYATELAKMCSDKAKTWDQRSSTRAAELSTLTQAIGIIKGAVKGNTTSNTIRFAQATSLRSAEAVAQSPGAMEAIEEEAEEEEEEAAPSFLETNSGRIFASIRRLRGSGNDEGAEFVRQMLESRGKELKSTVLTSLASQLAKDPFAKVKTLIQELITRLLQEANNEANQKGWCDRSIADAKQKRTYAADKILDLNSQMTKLESVRDALKEELAVLAKEIAEVQESQRVAKEERDAESAQNGATIEEAEEGLEALKLCIDLLDKFYKTISKGSVDLSLTQGPADDAPDAGFDNGEAYLGAQSENGGILGMLDVMKSDFVRTIQETTAAEAQAVADFEAFMTESGKSLATKTEAESAKKAQLDSADSEYAADQESMASQTMILKTAIKELLELKPVCIDTGMSYADRVARREEEIKALNKAVCVLERYQQYGPEGAASGC